MNCASNIHDDAPVPATTHGSFGHPSNPDSRDDDVWYCDRCAEMGVMLRLYKPEPREQGYCWPTLGEPCGHCHRCGGTQ